MLVVVGEKPLNKFPLALDRLPRILRSRPSIKFFPINTSRELKEKKKTSRSKAIE